MASNQNDTERTSEAHDRRYPVRGVHGRVVTEIGERIIGNRLPPGEPLPREAELMAEFSASRTTVREAIKVLAAKGLVEARQKLGLRVRPQAAWNLLDPDVLNWYAASAPSPQLTDHLVELRTMIEPAACRLAAIRRTAADLEALAQAFSQMSAATNDLISYYQADLAFHRAIFKAAGNPFVDRLGDIVTAVLEVSFNLQQRSLIPAVEGLVLHGPVINAIRERDETAAEQAMLTIIESARQELQAGQSGEN
ncbi:MAG: FadR/GntR family transcriptional regulator [Pseudomonadota bacterium]